MILKITVDKITVGLFNNFSTYIIHNNELTVMDEYSNSYVFDDPVVITEIVDNNGITLFTETYYLSKE